MKNWILKVINPTRRKHWKYRVKKHTNGRWKIEMQIYPRGRWRVLIRGNGHVKCYACKREAIFEVFLKEQGPKFERWFYDKYAIF